MKRNDSSTSRTWRAKANLRCLRPLLAVPLLIGGTAIVSNADVVQINPSDDSFVEDSLPNMNFGSSASMFVADAQPDSPNSIARSYLKFNLSTLPAGAVIDTAMIHIYATVIYYPAVSVGAYYLSNDGWSETGIGGITWNNAPTGFNPSPTALKVIDMAMWTSWDVTSDVQAVWADDGVYSVVMKEPAGDEGVDGNYVLFNTKDDPDPPDRPYLRIQYTPSTAVEEMIWSWGSIKAMFR
jgi:hypothetical protein